MSTITELKWQTMTAAINEMKSPNQFLKKLLFSTHQPVSTEDIELSVLTKSRECAPFVRKNGEAVMVTGHGEKFQTVSAPNIRIKRPFTPSELLFQRRPGTVIFSPGASEQLTALQAHVARDLKVMADMVTNTEEWLCAMALRGTITYSVSDAEVFQITFPKPSGNNVTLSTFWNDATPANVQMEEDFKTAKRLIQDEVGLGVTDAIMGSEAATYFHRVIKSQNAGNFGVIYNPGKAALAEQYSDDGVIYLGNFCGVDCWEYSRSADLNGVSTPMIRAKYVEFVTRSTASERVLYYGAIPDMDALEGRNFQGERFSKSWKQEDPSAWIALVQSRPLPVPRRPGSMVSMKVISG